MYIIHNPVQDTAGSEIPEGVLAVLDHVLSYLDLSLLAGLLLAEISPTDPALSSYWLRTWQRVVHDLSAGLQLAIYLQIPTSLPQASHNTNIITGHVWSHNIINIYNIYILYIISYILMLYIYSMFSGGHEWEKVLLSKVFRRNNWMLELYTLTPSDCVWVLTSYVRLSIICKIVRLQRSYNSDDLQ